MATSDEAAWRAMQSHLGAMGYNVQAEIGEPMAPPEPITAAIIPISGRVDETVLNAPRFVHVIDLRFYADGLAEDRDKVETTLDQIRADIFEDICGDFTLGGTMAYAFPTQCEWRYGWQAIGGRMYRLLDITIAYRVDVTYVFAE